MKNILLLLFGLVNLVCSAQCVDVFGSKVDCPTEADSLTVYNNALKVYGFYENSKSYTKTRTVEVLFDNDRLDVYESLQQARRLFFVIRRDVSLLKESEKKFASGKPKSTYVDIPFKNYYQEVDEYRFYQRELENQIINAEAPMSIYDTRICPIIVNEYKCLDSGSRYFGDIVNLPLYIPVTVKPYMLLTAEELVARNEILHIAIFRPSILKQVIKKEYKVLVNNKYVRGYPVYMVRMYGSGALIGMMINGRFKRIEPVDYVAYAVPKEAQRFLENEKELDKMLKIKFGGYYKGFYIFAK